MNADYWEQLVMCRDGEWRRRIDVARYIEEQDATEDDDWQPDEPDMEGR